MKLISWNVNGLRACLTHGFAESFAQLDADIFSVQETKMQPGQADFAPEGYTEYTYSAEKKGYSGTACWCREQPLAVTTGIGIEEHDHEGRVLTLEYPEFWLVNCYTPNSQDGLKRLDYRMEWENAFRAYLLALDAKKPVILCGDLNVAHTEIDIKNAKTNRMSAGFTDFKFGLFANPIGRKFNFLRRQPPFAGIISRNRQNIYILRIGFKADRSFKSE